ncbi:MAG: DUF2232 domain-containing protein [bacterium]|nr:YybS family protein [bacterium]MBU1917825.1 YybS family protein [bacterium]
MRRKTTFIMSLLTLGLFFSGFLVFLTPLPFIYHQLKEKDVSIYELAWPSLLLITAVYAFGIDFFYQFSEAHPTAYYFVLPIPYLGMAKHFSHTTVMLLGIGTFVMYMALSHLVAIGLNQTQKKCFSVMSFSILGVFGVCLLYGLIVVLPQYMSFLTAYQTALDEALKQFVETQRQAGMSMGQILALEDILRESLKNIFYLMPIVLLFFVSLVYYINTIVAKRFFAAYFPRLRKLDLTLFKAPFFLVWSIIGLLFVLLINELALNNVFVSYALLNCLLGMALVFMFQGIAVFIFILNKKNIQGFARLFIFLFMIILGEVVLLLLLGLGLVDAWFDFRNRDKTKAP